MFEDPNINFLQHNNIKINSLFSVTPLLESIIYFKNIIAFFRSGNTENSNRELGDLWCMGKGTTVLMANLVGTEGG